MLGRGEAATDPLDPAERATNERLTLSSPPRTPALGSDRYLHIGGARTGALRTILFARHHGARFSCVSRPDRGALDRPSIAGDPREPRVVRSPGDDGPYFRANARPSPRRGERLLAEGEGVPLLVLERGARRETPGGALKERSRSRRTCRDLPPGARVPSRCFPPKERDRHSTRSRGARHLTIPPHRTAPRPQFCVVSTIRHAGHVIRWRRHLANNAAPDPLYQALARRSPPRHVPLISGPTRPGSRKRHVRWR